jgi:hypothetical protein
MERRDFLKTATTAAGAAATEQFLAPMLRADEKAPDSGAGGMIYRTLGRTGERVSAIGLGGYHIGKPPLQEQDAIQLVRQAIDRGITTAASAKSAWARPSRAATATKFFS